MFTIFKQFQTTYKCILEDGVSGEKWVTLKGIVKNLF